MTAATIGLEIDGAVAVVTLNRPDKLNSFTWDMHQELKHALDQVEQAKVRALVLTGAGRGFCAGQDLGDPRFAGAERIDVGETLEQNFNPLIMRLRNMPFPVICAVNGVAAGAGANLALACDIVLAARSARFIQAFARIGLLPDAGGTWLLVHLVGEARAKALAMLADPLPAEQAEAWGLIWRAIDDDRLMDEALSLGRRLAEGPTRALAFAKQAIHAAAANDLTTQLDLERDLQRELAATDDFREGVDAFLAKRKPVFRGT